MRVGHSSVATRWTRLSKGNVPTFDVNIGWTPTQFHLYSHSNDAPMEFEPSADALQLKRCCTIVRITSDRFQICSRKWERSNRIEAIFIRPSCFILGSIIENFEISFILLLSFIIIVETRIIFLSFPSLFSLDSF